MPAAHVIIFGVAGLITVMVMAEADSKDMFRFLGVAAIIDAAITILIPIFHRLSMRETGPDHAAIDAESAKLQARIAELEKLKAN